MINAFFSENNNIKKKKTNKKKMVKLNLVKSQLFSYETSMFEFACSAADSRCKNLEKKIMFTSIY